MCYIHPTRLFQFQNDKNYLYWPCTIIWGCTIILISKTDNPTRLFHTVQLFGTLEYLARKVDLYGSEKLANYSVYKRILQVPFIE